MRLTDPSVRKPASTVELTTISASSHLPVRVRSALEGVLGLAGGMLERLLVLALTEYEQVLFKLAEKARSSDEQHSVFETLREVKRGRADIAPRFMLHLESTLAQLDAPKKSEPSNAPKRFQDLSLVDSRELEEDISLREIAAKAEIRHSQTLFALGHRFGVLACSPMLEADMLPVGPKAVCDALKFAGGALVISLEHRILMYRQFDKSVMPEIGIIYNAINDYLIEKGILRNSPIITPRLPSTHALSENARGDDHYSPHTDLAGHRPTTPDLRAHPGHAMYVQQEDGEASSFGLGEADAYNSPGSHAARPREARPLPHPSPRTPSASPREEPRDTEVFSTLRELLAGRRVTTSAAAPPAGSSSDYQASAEDLQAVLGSLQSRPAAPMMMGGRLVPRTVGHVRQDMLNQLRQLTPDGKPPQLAAEDADTIDLVGMLFDFINKDVKATGATQSLLTKLQVPILRVALRDKSFFTRRNHPARQLLNTIAETGQYWLDDSENESDKMLVEKMQLLVDRVTGEFDGKLELFEEMLTDLSRHMGTLARKAEVAERRNVDAAKGRERLDMARERAIGAVNERLANRKVSRLVRTLLEQAWTDVLALTILRQGEDSESYQRRINVADRLIDGTAAHADGVRAELEQGLSQVGFHTEEAQTMVRQVLAIEDESAADSGDSAATRTEVAIKIKNKARLGEDPAAPERQRASQRQQHISPPSTLRKPRFSSASRPCPTAPGSSSSRTSRARWCGGNCPGFRPLPGAACSSTSAAHAPTSARSSNSPATCIAARCAW
ncbi:DUF1631 domain-containing protein [Tahibacter amnicola]|uniref:DUF1631 domain-containing protein n=1 Tax=Tahibacter amnicola TaxID=2976241 RepID=A0ABY6BJ89_9GAMM|nr:DUF1631 domain-containing protein [Tahibacter amnicola]UXI67902.1 DUF1631 domain-containing protein [Tahibacter amnicola]